MPAGTLVASERRFHYTRNGVPMPGDAADAERAIDSASRLRDDQTVIPPFDSRGNLPPGIHSASWAEVVGRYGETPWRLELLAGLKTALDNLKAAGSRRAYLNGSFVTSKTNPGDFDGCWEVAGVDPALLAPVLRDWYPPRAAQKARFRGELLPVNTLLPPTWASMLDFFQTDRDGNPKGIISLDLGVLP